MYVHIYSKIMHSYVKGKLICLFLFPFRGHWKLLLLRSVHYARQLSEYLGSV